MVALERGVQPSWPTGRARSGWCGEPGLARIETPSPASFFDASDGFQGSSTTPGTMAGSISRAQSGVMYLHPAAPGDRRRFMPLAGHRQPVLVVRRHGRSRRPRPAVLAVACSDGLYEIHGLTHAARSVRRLTAPFAPRRCCASVVDPTRLWVGLVRRSGLVPLGGRSVDRRGPRRGRHRTDPCLSEREDGSLWAGTSSRGVLHISFATTPEPGRARPALATAERFGEKEVSTTTVCSSTASATPCSSPAGAAGRRNFVATWDRRPGASSAIRPSSVQPFDVLSASFGLAGLPDGRLLVNFGRGTVGRHPYADGSWTFDSSAFGAYGRASHRRSRRSSPAASCGSADRGRLIRFDLSRRAASPPAAFAALVRRVVAPSDRVLFAGAGAAESPRLQSGEGTLRFEFSAPTFFDETRPNTRPGSTVSTTTGRRGHGRRARLHQPRASATIGSTSGLGTSPAHSAATPPTRSPSCRRGIAPGGPTPATWLCSG